jgi:hypothetical protein
MDCVYSVAMLRQKAKLLMLFTSVITRLQTLEITHDSEIIYATENRRK